MTTSAAFVSSDKPTICLNLICKNEAPVIERCIRSCLPIIDSWCIVDTGSTDDTMQIIQSVLGHLPGKLYQSPWKNFGHNKTEALQLAREHGDFALLMDADDVLEIADGFAMPDLPGDAYRLRIQYDLLEYERVHLVRTSKTFRYVGVRHEYLDCAEPFETQPAIKGIRYKVVGGGNRSVDPKKYIRDAEALAAERKRDPKDPRTVFYLAQSYRDAGMFDKALKTYRQRAEMPGWVEENFIAKLEAAQLAERLKERPESIINSYLRAWEYRPTRAEPLHRLALYLRMAERYELAYQFANIGRQIPMPDDLLFVDTTVYRWKLADECAVSAYWSGRKEVCKQLNGQLMAVVPDSEKPRIMQNMWYCEPQASEPQSSGPQSAQSVQSEVTP